jgi:CheY-like chemotaxis protein
VERKHIFIAEDDPASRELLTEALELCGYEVHACANGAQLLEDLEGTSAALVILDIQMPVLDGLETIKRLRQSDHANTPVVALTAFAMTTDRERILASGFDAYLTKPISLPELRMTAEKLLTHSSREPHGC